MATGKKPPAPKKKAAAPKKPAAPKKKAAKARVPAFPFLGQGSAGYYEWLTMYVWFVEPVPKASRKKVLASIPKPLGRSVAWEGSVLSCGTGDQFVHLHISDAYPSDDEDDDFDPDDFDISDLDEQTASADQLAKFEADIEKWLRETNEQFPILFAVRSEDGEGGGTKLGAWHKASMEQLRTKLLPMFAAHRKELDTLPGWAMGSALEFLAQYDPKSLDAASKAWLERWTKKVRR